MNHHARWLVETLQVGTLILFSRNIQTPLQCRQTVRQLRSLRTLPLLVAVDQEGGRVVRFGPPLHRFPGNAALGRITTGDGNHPRTRAAEHWARLQAAVQAAELRAVDVDWNLAPVVDVNSNPLNPVIGDRSFGSDPQRVARFGCAMIEGYQSGGLMACAKHFPGHGDTSVDSHLSLPTIHRSRSELEETELPPFRAAVKAGAASIMVGHLLLPSIDPHLPASCSPNIVQGLLRTELGYEGLVITDDLEMGAITHGIGTSRAAVLALKAGADVVSICHTRALQREAAEAVKEALQRGELPMARLDEAASRVLRSADRLNAGRWGPADPDPWNDPATDILEQEIERRSGGGSSNISPKPAGR
jgi:beta-N-acetylhexosaminidase